MDYKEKVEWLGRYQASVSCQHMLEEEIEVLRSDAERVTACMSGMPGRSGPPGPRRACSPSWRGPCPHPGRPRP